METAARYPARSDSNTAVLAGGRLTRFSAIMLPIAILAGGLGTRLRPATGAAPKSLIEIRGEPFLAHQLRLLRRNGITKAVLCLGHRGDQIQNYAGDGNKFGIHLDYSFDGRQLLGTGGSLIKALPLLGDAFFVLYGDSYLTCDYSAVERAFFASGRSGLMTVFRNDGRWQPSNIELSECEIKAYDKMNPTARMCYIDYGLGVFRRSALSAFPERSAFDMAEVYNALIERRELAAYEIASRFFEIGSFAGIRELEEYLSR